MMSRIGLASLIALYSGFILAQTVRAAPPAVDIYGDVLGQCSQGDIAMQSATNAEDANDPGKGYKLALDAREHYRDCAASHTGSIRIQNLLDEAGALVHAATDYSNTPKANGATFLSYLNAADSIVGSVSNSDLTMTQKQWRDQIKAWIRTARKQAAS